MLWWPMFFNGIPSRFLRDGILNRGRATSDTTSINWRDVILHDFQLEQQGSTVCKNLQQE